MDARELVLLAGTVATHAPLLMEHGEPFPTAALERYWTTAKCRQENWGRALKEFGDSWRGEAPATTEVACQIQPLLEEILTAEVLGRVWAAVSTLADARRGTADASAIGQNVLAGHQETRHRVLNLMVYGYGLGVADAVALNRLRIRNEHWTDTLLAVVGGQTARPDWAYQPDRVTRLARTLHAHQTAARRSLATSAVLAGLTLAYPRPAAVATPHAELHRRIASSILACFPPFVFDGAGQLGSVQQLWLLRASGDQRGQLLVTPRSPRRRF